MRFGLILLLLFALVGVLLATQPENLTNEVDLALPFISAVWTGPVLWMLAGFFGAGLLLGYLIAVPGRISTARRARRAEKERVQTETSRAEAVGHLNEADPAARRASPTEADEMQRLADEVARRTETVKGGTPPPRA